jgi:hypothetical protein
VQLPKAAVEKIYINQHGYSQNSRLYMRYIYTHLSKNRCFCQQKNPLANNPPSLLINIMKKEGGASELSSPYPPPLSGGPVAQSISTPPSGLGSDAGGYATTTRCQGKHNQQYPRERIQ